eukprot:CAMPEP_0202905130 /NCGR_PEP_ID=MMETSP1392-20130828/32723_1 /ASSEMBLY_ACC=CAM_ASM_000868 /TAXON_ID=225041 /ORGANISM="Chlamydomonas chlamydogama, Strain SAG 11-48b" /LENGTH=137 /DNA_ID=CAMNT_0049593089 /DNA_START=413 /DNA_END=823 /DNA_ORIENTATION=-
MLMLLHTPFAPALACMGRYTTGPHHISLVSSPQSTTLDTLITAALTSTSKSPLAPKPFIPEHQAPGHAHARSMLGFSHVSSASTPNRHTPTPTSQLYTWSAPSCACQKHAFPTPSPLESTLPFNSPYTLVMNSHPLW